MALRPPRLLVAHYPHHVVQRGHSRKAVFEGTSDRQVYLDDLYEKKIELGVEVHAGREPKITVGLAIAADGQLAYRQYME